MQSRLELTIPDPSDFYTSQRQSTSILELSNSLLPWCSPHGKQFLFVSVSLLIWAIVGRLHPTVPVSIMMGSQTSHWPLLYQPDIQRASFSIPKMFGIAYSFFGCWRMQRNERRSYNLSMKHVIKHNVWLQLCNAEICVWQAQGKRRGIMHVTCAVGITKKTTEPKVGNHGTLLARACSDFISQHSFVLLLQMA